MIKIVSATPEERRAFIAQLKARAGTPDPKVEARVRAIIQKVEAGGDQAVIDFSRQFDGWSPERLEMGWL